MDELDYIKVCRKKINPRDTDVIMTKINALIPLVSIPKKAFRIGGCGNSDRSFSDNNPGWEYHCYSIENVRETIVESFPDMIHFYDSMTTDQERINIGSYIYQYLFGGVYLAQNIEVTRSFDDLFYFDSEVYLTQSPSYPNAYTNSFMASKPKSKFWLDVLDEVKKLTYTKPFWVIGNHLKTTISTGSGALTSGARNTRIPIMILPTVLVSANSCCDIPKSNNHAYIRIIPTKESWDEQLLNYCWCKSDWIPYLIIGFFVFLFIFIIFHSTKPQVPINTQYEWFVRPTKHRMNMKERYPDW